VQTNETVLPRSLEEVLMNLSADLYEHSNEPGNLVNVRRCDVLDGGYRAFLRPSFNVYRRLFVKFSNELAIDESLCD